MHSPFESTYALLVRSEDKRRNALEIALYLICVMTALVAILQFAHTPVNVTAPGIQQTFAANQSQPRTATKVKPA